MNEQSSNEFFHGSSFMQGQNAEYLENLRLNFKENENSVDSAWQAFFQSLESNVSEPSEGSVKPSWTRQDWPQQPNDELTNALMNEWNTDSEFAIRAGQEINAKANEANITLNNDAEIVEWLLETGEVAAVPGVAFGLEPFFRVSYATSLELLKDAMDRIERSVSSLA